MYSVLDRTVVNGFIHCELSIPIGSLDNRRQRFFGNGNNFSYIRKISLILPPRWGKERSMHNGFVETMFRLAYLELPDFGRGSRSFKIEPGLVGPRRLGKNDLQWTPTGGASGFPTSAHDKSTKCAPRCSTFLQAAATLPT
jgi:hypothetical protein